MSQLRFNPLNLRWVTVATERASRPHEFAPRRLPVEAYLGRECPFCPGNEEVAPPALETYGPKGTWLVRVLPNLYPAFDGGGEMKITEIGPVFKEGPASGIHEVLVLSPDHRASWADLEDRQAGLVMAAIRDRMEDHARLSSVRYTQVILNHGREAGASIEHPHGQLLGIPFVPGELVEELRGFDRFEHGSLLEVTIQQELEARQRIVVDNDRVLVLCPYWSGSPYEMLVIPKRRAGRLDLAKPGDLAAVGRALRTVLERLRSLLGDVAYNLVFHSAPPTRTEDFHWHVHVLPKVTTVAGFEQGTGVRINIVAPELAASQLTPR